MCMLSFYPAGADPVKDHLVAGGKKNRDGYGYAIVSGVGAKHIKVGKSMKRDELIEEFMTVFAEVRAKHPNAVALFHSRWGTGGSRDEYNCHPFFVGRTDVIWEDTRKPTRDPLTVLGHNGVFFSPDGYSKGSRRCDTRIVAEDMFVKYPNLDDKECVDWWTESIGRGNKVVVLTASRLYKKRAYLINPQAGQWVGTDGKTTKAWEAGACWHSNSDWRPTVKYSYSGSGLGWGYEDSWSVNGKWIDGKWVRGRWVKAGPGSGSVFEAGHYEWIVGGKDEKTGEWVNGRRGDWIPEPMPEPKPEKKAEPAAPLALPAGDSKPGPSADTLAEADAHPGVTIFGDDGWAVYRSPVGSKPLYKWRPDEQEGNGPATPRCPNQACGATGDALDDQSDCCLVCDTCLSCGWWIEQCKCYVEADEAATAAVIVSGGGTRYGDDPDSECTGSNIDPLTLICDDHDCVACAARWAERHGGYVLGSRSALIPSQRNS